MQAGDLLAEERGSVDTCEGDWRVAEVVRDEEGLSGDHACSRTERGVTGPDEGVPVEAYRERRDG